MKVLATLILIMTFVLSYAQSPGDYQRLLLEVLNAKKKDKVAEHLVLDEKQNAAFWPLYDEFTKKLNAVEEQRIDLLTEFGNMENGLTEETAEDIWKRYRSYEVERHDLFTTYYPRFKKAVGAVNTVTYYQIEAKLEALVRSKAAEDVPLLNTSD